MSTLRRRHHVLLLSALLPSLLVHSPSQAQIRTDASLGKAAQSLSGPSFLIPETLGKLAGSNLFHSFQTFNIGTGESATFTTSSSGIANVISRVTGGAASTINGPLTLTAANGTSNFFFINPAGVTFGAGASIDVPGAFHVSTADYVKFPDGNYYADTARASTFSSMPPEAFGFLGATKSAIEIDAYLETKPKQSIDFVAGDVLIDNGYLSSSGGDIRISALGQARQEVALSGVVAEAHGTLVIQNIGYVNSGSTGEHNGGDILFSAGSIKVAGSSIISTYGNTVSTYSAGDIAIYSSGDFSLDNSFIATFASGSGNAGDINVTASSLSVLNGGTISTSTFTGSGSGGKINLIAGSLSILNGGQISSDSAGTSSGNGGSIKINAGAVSLDGQNSTYTTGISATTSMFSRGNAGSIELMVSGPLSVRRGFIESSNQAKPFSSRSSIGTAGSIKVIAEAITLDGQGAFGTGIRAEDFTTKSYDTSRVGGFVDVTALGNLSILGGAAISTSTIYAGKTGAIKVGAGTLLIDGQSSNYQTGIFSDAGVRSKENGGHVEVISSGTLTILNGGEISSSIGQYASGDGGSLTVKANTLLINRQGSPWITGIYSRADVGSMGSAGFIDVNVSGNLSLLGGGAIDSSTWAGSAGSVSVSADQITVDGVASGLATGIFSDANKGSTGNAGNVAIMASGNVSLLNGGRVSSDTSSLGHAGNVSIKTSTLLVDGSDERHYPSAVQAIAQHGSSGQTGSVSVSASDGLAIQNGAEIAIRNDAIVASPDSLHPTLLTVIAPTVILKDAAISAASTGNVAASNIVVNASEILHLDPSSITTSAKDGNGGSITINGGKLVQLDNSQITTSVAGLTGNGGNIKISADILLMNTGFIQANTAAANAIGGDVAINVKSLIPSGNSLFLGGSSPYSFQPYIFGYNVIQAAAPTGVSGTVTTSAPVLDISGSLVGLSTKSIDTGGLGRNPCQSLGGSSLATTGRGGLPVSNRGAMRHGGIEPELAPPVVFLPPPQQLATFTPCTAL